MRKVFKSAADTGAWGHSPGAAERSLPDGVKGVAIGFFCGRQHGSPICLSECFGRDAGQPPLENDVELFLGAERFIELPFQKA
jgi:hypothetical protein